MTVSTRVDDELYEWIKADAEDRGISMSEWLLDLIYVYISGESNLTLDDLEDMDWDELVEVVDDLELDIDPSDFIGGAFKSVERETSELREAIAEELDLYEDEKDEEKDEE